MDITFFYTRKQLDIFLNSRFGSTILCNKKSEKISTLNEGTKNMSGALSLQLVGILEHILETKKVIDPVIKKYLQNIENSELLGILNYSNGFSAWREKSFLIRISILSLGRPFTEPLTKAATAIELFGMSACLVDDLIDEATFYDLKETTWLKYGSKETITACKLLSSLSTKALIDSCVESGIGVRDFEEVINVFENIKYNAYIGQFMDIRSERLPDFSKNDYFEMISRFPGALYAGTLQIAGLLSGIKDSQVQTLKEFGHLFGMANQIRDDLIEIIGEEEAIGKKIGADILRKKKRLPIILLLERSSKYAKLFRESNIGEKHLSGILNEMRSSDIVNICISHINDFVNRSVCLLNSCSKNPWQELLKTLALYLGEFKES